MATFILIVLSLFLAGDIAWWVIGARLQRRRQAPGWMKVLHHGFMLMAVGSLVLLLLGRSFRWSGSFSTALVMFTFIWHLFVLPGTLIAATVISTGLLTRDLLSRSRRRDARDSATPDIAPQPLSSSSQPPGHESPGHESLGHQSLSQAPGLQPTVIQPPGIQPNGHAKGGRTDTSPTPGHAAGNQPPHPATSDLGQTPGQAPDKTPDQTPDLSPDLAPDRRMLSRRSFLLAASVVPPLITLGALGYSATRLDHFRVRRITVPVVGLPPALDGLTIAHLSDSHVGDLTQGSVLRDIVDQTNALNPDITVMTGDLINRRAEDLPAACDMLKAIRSRYGLFVVEGNHDLFDGRAVFERTVRQSGLNLLVNETDRVTVNGQAVQLLGLRWGGPGERAARDRSEEAIAQSMRELLLLRNPSAFPILLAHHPHAFDYAVPAGVPLTLTGHTHGGQLMLTPNIGPGPIMYRYWSGLYQRDRCSTVVSNGVGNWFPLRVNAPAEIIHITLKPA